MYSHDAVSVLKNIAYKPGWSFDAMAYSAMPQYEQMLVERTLGQDVPRSTVLFHWVFNTVDTDREYARGGYLEPKRLEDTIPFAAVEFLDADELLFFILHLLIELEEHETREFFRCKDRDWQAPFHPHRTEGAELWDKCMRRFKTN